MKINLRNAVLKGTLILTSAGIATRVLGFFYRIYITRLIGSEGMGIYQLVMPFAGVIYAISVAGISTAISRFTAEQPQNLRYTRTGIFLSLPLSLLCTFFCWTQADFIAQRILFHEDCAFVVKMLSLTFPFSSLHNCIAGYYFGKKKVAVPAISSLLEQLVRIGSVLIIATCCMQAHIEVTVSIILIGNILGDIAATTYNLIAITFFRKPVTTPQKKHPSTLRISFLQPAKSILTYSLPLTLNRVLMHLLQSGEAVLIPVQLILYGNSQQEALSLYGVLAGMALPFISFPSAITNSLSVMLLPEIAGAQAQKKNKKIVLIIRQTIQLCLYMGLFFTLIFITIGAPMSVFMFANDTVGHFVRILAWICPFQYLASTLGSILNGLGKTSSTCVTNIAGLLLRIGFLIVLTPKIGISGYLYGLLFGQILVCIAHFIQLNRMFHL